MSHYSTLQVKGSTQRTYKFLNAVSKLSFEDVLSKYGVKGVEALREATPKDTGKTADSWDYKIEPTAQGATIIWENSNVVQHVNIALILQYGHGTGTGGWVQGIDYINPALAPVFEQILRDLWREVTTA